MKKVSTYFGCIALFLIGMQVSVAQIVEQKQSEESVKQTILSNERAKDQTFDLHQIVNLQGDQLAKVNEMFLDLDKRERLIASNSDKTAVELKSKELQTIKNEKLKEILTAEQYNVYLNLIKNEKR